MAVIICLSELIKNVLGITAEIFIFKTLFKTRYNVNKICVWFVSIAFAAMSLLPLLLLGNTEEAKDVADIVTLTAFITFPYIFFKLKKKGTLFLLGLITNATVDFLVLMISLPINSISTLTKNLIYCSVYLLFIISFVVIAKRKLYIIKGELFEKIPTVFYIVVLLAELAAFYMVMLTKNDNYQKEISDLLIVALAALIVVCITLVVFMIVRLSEKQKHSENALEIQLKYNEDMQIKNRNIRKFRHDYKNHMMSLELLLTEGRFAEAQEYITKLSSLPEVNGKNFCTGNTLADAIMSVKLSEAVSKGINISFEGTIPSLGIDNCDLSVILGNALDNAIRECEKISDCEICVISKKHGDFLVLKIINPVKECVSVVNNTVYTTKNDAQNHGFGIEQMKSVAKKYNGTVNIECDKKIFSIEIGLIIREVKKHEKVY